MVQCLAKSGSMLLSPVVATLSQLRLHLSVGFSNLYSLKNSSLSFKIPHTCEFFSCSGHTGSVLSLNVVGPRPCSPSIYGLSLGDSPIFLPDAFQIYISRIGHFPQLNCLTAHHVHMSVDTTKEHLKEMYDQAEFWISSLTLVLPSPVF